MLGLMVTKVCYIDSGTAEVAQGPKPIPALKPWQNGREPARTKSVRSRAPGAKGSIAMSAVHRTLGS